MGHVVFLPTISESKGAFYFRTFASDYKADNMRRPQIIERIRKALGQVAPDAKAILYGSEARGDACPDSDIDSKNQST